MERKHDSALQDTMDLARLQTDLEEAVAREDFAAAAGLRDALRRGRESGQSAVLLANSQFYEAFQRRSLPAMEKLWGSGAHVGCLHPGSNILVGREQARSAKTKNPPSIPQREAAAPPPPPPPSCAAAPAPRSPPPGDAVLGRHLRRGQHPVAGGGGCARAPERRAGVRDLRRADVHLFWRGGAAGGDQHFRAGRRRRLGDGAPPGVPRAAAAAAGVAGVRAAPAGGA